MAGGRFVTTCTLNYGEMYKVIAPFGTTLDCDMWRGALGTRQMAQFMIYAEWLCVIARTGWLYRDNSV